MTAPGAGPARPGPRREPDRWLAALCIGVAGGAHVPLIADHLREAPYAGVAFILFVASCAVLGLGLVLRDTTAVWVGVVALDVSAVVAYVVTRTVGLPQLSDDVGHWSEPLSFPALASELLAAGIACAVLRSRAARG